MPRIYSDTPIGEPVRDIDVDVPRRISEMMGVLGPEGGESAGRAFVRAARMMEDYEDDHVYTGSFPQVLRTYRSMTVPQLRGYFGWRTRLRRGDAEMTPYPSYAYTYACELVNGVGWRDPDEGFDMLADLLDAYSGTDWFAYPFDWICDFAACYGVHLRRGLSSPWSAAVNAMSRLDSLTPEEAMPLIRSISGYDLERSKAFRMQKGRIEEAALLTLRNLDAGWTRVSGVSLKDTLFPSEWRHYYRMFPTAVYDDPGDDGRREYTVEGVAYYERNRGSWSKATYGMNRGMIRTVGLAMRALDARVRIRCGIRPLLKPNIPDDSWIAGCADDALKALDALERERALAAVAIDPESLERIRRDAEDTMEMIMTSEERPDDEGAVPTPPAPADRGLLDPAEAGFLRILLSGGDWRGYLADMRLMESVVVDSINGKLYDVFSDNVIEEGDDGPSPVDDYIKDLEAIVSP